MLDWLPIVLIALATWRVTSMLVQEDGPFTIFRRVRRLWGIQHDDTGCIFNVPDNNMAKLFSCQWCMSVWIGPALYGLWFIAPVAILLLAISAGAILIQCATGGR